MALSEMQHRALHEAVNTLTGVMVDVEDGSGDKESTSGGVMYAVDLLWAVLANDDEKAARVISDFESGAPLGEAVN